MPCLDDWRGLIPDSVCSLVDDAHEFPWKCVELKVSLKCVGHLLKWAMLVPELQQPEAVCQQEIVDAEPGAVIYKGVHEGVTPAQFRAALEANRDDARRRLAELIVRIHDRPGALAAVTALLAEQGANILQLDHRRGSAGLRITEAEVELTLETRGRTHVQSIVRAPSAPGPSPPGRLARGARSLAVGGRRGAAGWPTR